jgi:hypothetical protein
MGWLQRLSTGQVASVERPTLVFTLPEATSVGASQEFLLAILEMV